MSGALVKDVWLEPVVTFATMERKIKDMPKEVLDDLSRDASILYKLGNAIQTGVVPPDVVAATIGPPSPC